MVKGKVVAQMIRGILWIATAIVFGCSSGKEETKKVIDGVSYGSWYSQRTESRAGIVPDGWPEGKIT